LSTNPHPVRGYLYIGSATFLWGVAAALGRAAFTGRLLPAGQALQPIDPLILSQSRTTFSFLVLLPILAAGRGWKTLKLPPVDLRQCLLLGVFGVAASNYLYYFAIQKTNVATAIILQYTAPMWVLVYMVSRGLQKPTIKRVSAVALAVIGCALAIGIVGAGGFRLNPIGVAAALLASFSFAFYNVGGHSILARYDRWIVLLWTLLAAALFWMVVNPPWKVAAAHYGASQWLFLFVFSLVSVLGPFSLYFAGLQHLEPTRAIVASCLEPVFSIVIAAVALGEIMQPIQTVGIVIVLAAIVLVQLPERGVREEITVVEPIE
jgi:DME family drug/metabolite transporter